MNFAQQSIAPTPWRRRFGVALRNTSPWWLPVLIGCVALAICWLRLPPESRNTLWAEDGRIFVSEREQFGPLNTLFRPYAGYLQFVPRLIADAVIGFVPVERWAIGFTALSCVVAAVACGITFVCTRSVVRGLSTRIALAVIPALVPIAPIEVSGNAANVHAYFLWLMPWLLLAKPQRRTTSAVLGLVALTGALTEIQSVVFLPLVVWRWRESRGWPVRIGLLVGLAAQLVATISNPRPPGRAVVYHLWSVVEGFAANVVMGSITAQSHTVYIAFTSAIVVVIAVAVVFAASTLLALVRGGAETRLAVIVCVVAATVIWTAGYLANPYPGFDFATYNQHTWAAFGFMRYGVVPAMFLLATVPLAADVLVTRAARSAVLVAAALVAIVVITQWTVPSTQRSAGPVWSNQVSVALRSCQTETKRAFVSVPVAPAGWSARVRCTEAEGLPE